MTKLSLASLFALLCVLMVGRTAAALPIQWTSGPGANGHYYEFVFANNISWTSADAAADASSYLGLPGHLATITSGDENAFLTNYVSTSLAGTDFGPWFGGFQATQPPTQTNPTLNWQWVTGETWSYTDWRPLDLSIYPYPEPNDVNNVENNEENYTHFHSPGPTPWKWNDAPNVLPGIPGYLVEFEPAPTAIPEPATISLLGIGAATLALRRRR